MVIVQREPESRQTALAFGKGSVGNYGFKLVGCGRREGGMEMWEKGRKKEGKKGEEKKRERRKERKTVRFRYR